MVIKLKRKMRRLKEKPRFEVVRGDGDRPLIQVEFKVETKRFTPEISSMVLPKMRETAEVFMRKEVKNMTSRAPRTSTTRSVRRRRMLV